MYFSTFTFVILIDFLYFCNNLFLTVNAVRSSKNGVISKFKYKPEWQVINGSEANVLDYPYSVIVLFIEKGNYEELCSGSIISNNYFLTACHCVIIKDEVNGPFDFTASPETFLAGVGMDKIKKSKIIKGRNAHEIEKITVHPDCKRNVMPHDVAVFKVATPFNLNDKVKPVKLPDDLVDTDEMEERQDVCHLAGFGSHFKNEKEPELFVIKAHLNVIPLKILNLNICIALHPDVLVERNHICMYSKYGNIVYGDSGAGVVCGSGENRFLFGIILRGENATKGIPRHAIITRLDENLLFIHDAMGLIDDKSSASSINLMSLLKQTVAVFFMYNYLVPSMFSYIYKYYKRFQSNMSIITFYWIFALKCNRSSI